MKDIRIYKESTLLGTLRVDAISATGNITVMAHSGRPTLAESADQNYNLDRGIFNSFEKMPTSFEEVAAHCEANGLVMVVFDVAQKAADVYSAGLLSVTTANPLVNGNNGIAYTDTVEVSGGSQDFTFSISAGSLPSQLTLNASTGVISGTPDTVEQQTFTVKVVDNFFDLEVEKEFTIDIQA